MPLFRRGKSFPPPVVLRHPGKQLDHILERSNILYGSERLRFQALAKLTFRALRINLEEGGKASTIERLRRRLWRLAEFGDPVIQWHAGLADTWCRTGLGAEIPCLDLTAIPAVRHGRFWRKQWEWLSRDYGPRGRTEKKQDEAMLQSIMHRSRAEVERGHLAALEAVERSRTGRGDFVLVLRNFSADAFEARLAGNQRDYLLSHGSEMEQEFHDALGEDVVTVSVANQFYPPPLRPYARNLLVCGGTRWKAAIQELVVRAAKIVLLVEGVTPGLLFEIESVLHHGRQNDAIALTGAHLQRMTSAITAGSQRCLAADEFDSVQRMVAERSQRFEGGFDQSGRARIVLRPYAPISQVYEISDPVWRDVLLAATS